MVYCSCIQFTVLGVAFDGKFNRLGHGRGYYDRYLSEIEEKYKKFGHSMPICIGIALDIQKVDDVPMSEFDRKLDFVIFPNL